MGRERKILIVDDSEINRAVLAGILGGEYAILEAANGVEAVAALRDRAGEISLVLLDMIMPELDGFGVLDAMNENRWIDDIPVLVISSESAPSFIARAYDRGACDFIARPFDASIVRRRVMNVLLLYAKQKELAVLLAGRMRRTPDPGSPPASDRALALLEREREKHDFFAAMSQEIQFEYNSSPSVLTLSPWGAERTGLDGIILNPGSDPGLLSVVGREDLEEISRLLRDAGPEHPVVRHDVRLRIDGEPRWHRIIARAMPAADGTHEYRSAIGKAADIHESRTERKALERAARQDGLTGLLNRKRMEEIIASRLGNPGRGYALAIFDLDFFKKANDTYGHMFGDEVLVHVADRLRRSVRGTDVSARAGGDEFMIFIGYDDDEIESAAARVFAALCGQYKDFSISVSMGVSTTRTAGRDYAELYRTADLALYAAKRSGRGRYKFYDASME